MFKTILAVLVIAIIFLGIKIRDMSYEMDKDIAQKKTLVKEAIKEIKEDVSEKIQKAEEIYGKMKSELEKDENAGKSTKPEDKLNTGIKLDTSPSKKIKDAKPPIKFEPVDEEDRRLTSEVLNHDKKKVSPEQISTKDPVESDIQNLEKVPERNHEPKDSRSDIDRLANIRNLYFEAIEVLTWE